MLLHRLWFGTFIVANLICGMCLGCVLILQSLTPFVAVVWLVASCIMLVYALGQLMRRRQRPTM